MLQRGNEKRQTFKNPHTVAQSAERSDISPMIDVCSESDAPPPPGGTDSSRAARCRRARPSPRQTTLLSLLCVRRSGAAGAKLVRWQRRVMCGMAAAAAELADGREWGG